MPNQPSVIYRVLDSQHNLVAAALKHPAGWEAQSHVDWSFQRYSVPVRVFFRTFDPQGPAMVEFFPIEPYCWIEPNLGFQREGQDAGGGALLLKPMPAADALMRWVIPKYRGDPRGFRITNVVPVPDLASRLGVPPAANVMREGVRVTLEVAANGMTFEEEFYGLKVMSPGISTYGGAGCLVQYNWGFERLFSLRAEKGRLDSLREQLWEIVLSVKVNPLWERLLAHVTQQIAQQFEQAMQVGYAQIEAAGRISRQISAQSNAWLEQQQHQREAATHADQQRRHQEQAAWGRYTTDDAFSDYIMGRETYHDPYEEFGSSQHAGSRDYVWTDRQGNYQYSDDALFDPNLGANTEWVLMKKKTVGE